MCESIATTNRDLKVQIEDKAFREDLFYRLNVVPILLPALRERKEDIPHLVEYFIKKYNSKNFKKIKGASTSAIKALQDYDWPGNVRELENMIQRAVVFSAKPTLQKDHFHFETPSEDCKSDHVVPTGLSLEEHERNAILTQLKKQNGSRQKTAEILKISTRTLRNKLNQYRDEGFEFE